jgi:hypothetical protein
MSPITTSASKKRLPDIVTAAHYAAIAEILNYAVEPTPCHNSIVRNIISDTLNGSIHELHKRSILY